MGYQARLVYGQRVMKRYLNLNDTTYSLSTFAPPPLVSGGVGEVDIYKMPDRAIAFDVRIMGASIPETHNAVARIQDMLTLADDESDRLYFEFTPTDDAPYRQLTFGQYGAPYRYWIKSGTVAMSQRLPYDTGGETREKVLFVTLNLLCAAWAEGIEQSVGYAKGGIYEDTLTTTNKVTRGTVIPGATGTGGNEFTNPVFDNDDWDNGWTSSNAALVATANHDPSFIIYGNTSAKLTNKGAASYNFRQSINTGDTNSHTVSCYARLPDGGAISATQCTLFHNTAGTSTYQAMGNGWYRIHLTVTGISGATNIGIQVEPGYTVYVDGFQFEEASNRTQLCVGDMVGCAWGGTRHASASTRAAGVLKYVADRMIDPGQGTLCFVWKPQFAYNEYGDFTFFDATGASDAFYLNYTGSTTDKFYFDIGGNAVQSSAQTWVAGTILVIHVVWGPGTMKIYINGAADGSGSTFDPPVLNDFFYLGTNTSELAHNYGTYHGFHIYNRILTAGEIAAEYGAIADHVTGGDGYGQQLETLPYFWNKDGDGILDNVDDSGRDNWGVIGGVGGSLPAYLLLVDYPGSSVSENYIHSEVPYMDFVLPTNQWYSDQTSTATDSAGTSGETYLEVTMSGAGSTSMEYAPAKPWLMDGKFHFFMRAAIASGTDIDVTITPYIVLGLSTGTNINGTAVTITLTTTYKWYYLGSITAKQPYLTLNYQKLGYVAGIQWDWGAGASHTGKLDYFMVVNGGYLRIIDTGSAAWVLHIFDDIAAFGATTSANNTLITEDTMPTRGDFIQPLPGKYTVLWWSNADHNSAHTITHTLYLLDTIAPYLFGLWITPRYGIL